MRERGWDGDDELAGVLEGDPMFGAAGWIC